MKVDEEHEALGQWTHKLSPESWRFDFENVSKHLRGDINDTRHTTAYYRPYLCCLSTLLHTVTVKESIYVKTHALGLDP